MRPLTLLIALFVITFPLSVFGAININTADKDALISLSGIGEVKAQAIIDYRATNGPFAAIEEIQNVSGIGSVTFNNIKDFITVSGTSVVEEDQPEIPEPQDVQSVPQTTGGGVFIEDKRNISIDVGVDRTVFVGADSVFRADVRGLIEEPLESARVVWSFGNGDRKEGQNVLSHFQFPGTYVVIADASSGKYGASDRVIITAIPAAITISDVTNEYIGVVNKSGVELDLGGWVLTANGKQFQFPKSTIVLPDNEVLVSNKRTGLVPTSPESVALLYPNGLVATNYEYPLFVSRAPSSSSSQRTGSVPRAGNTNSENNTQVAHALAASTQVTSPILAINQNNQSVQVPGMLMWFIALLGLVTIGGASVLFIRKSEFKEFSIEEVQ